MNEDRKTPVLELEHIYKVLGGAPVLDDVSLSVKKGEFIGVVGTNGSGKTVLAHIITGVMKPDSGQILVDGRPVKLSTPMDAASCGIHAVNQDVALAEKLSVAENICIDLRKQSRGGIIFWRNWYQSAQELLDGLSINLSAKSTVKSLNLGQKRLVELAHIYARHPKIAVFDDCFATLTPQELVLVEDVIRLIRGEGVTVIYFSHRIEPFFKECDSVLFIRDTHITGMLSGEEYSESAAFTALLKGQKKRLYPKLHEKNGHVVMEVSHLSTTGRLKDISFSLRRGEILGVAGGMDSGKHELARVLFGAEPSSSGDIYINSQKVTACTPRNIIKHHVGYLSEDTEGEGLVLPFDIEQNIGIARLSGKDWVYFGKQRTSSAASEEYIRTFHIDCTSKRQRVSDLSAGNRQKVNLAKWLQADCTILILEEPFKEIDSANLVDLYNIICQMADAGKSIILFNSDYEELIGLSDRILVLKDGIVSDIIDGTSCTEEKLLKSLQ